MHISLFLKIILKRCWFRIRNNCYFVVFLKGIKCVWLTVNVTGCGFDLHSRKLNIYWHIYFHFLALVSRQSATLTSATQHTMPPEFGRKWGTECLNTRFPLPTLLCAEYSVKLKKIVFLGGILWDQRLKSSGKCAYFEIFHISKIWRVQQYYGIDYHNI